MKTRTIPVLSIAAIGCFLGTLSVAVFFCATAAAAQNSASAEAARAGKVPVSDVHVGAYTGIFLAPHASKKVMKHAGGMLGIHARYRLALFEVGGFGEVGGEVGGFDLVGGGGFQGGSSYAGFGATAGFAWRPSFNLRIAAYGAFGLHEYGDVVMPSRTFSGSDPETHGSTPFAGARAAMSYLFGRGKNHVELGIMGLYDGDLDRRSVMIGDAIYTLGTDRFGVLVTVGGTHDFL